MLKNDWSKKLQVLHLACCVTLAFACAVEAGNPHGNKPKPQSGALVVSFAKEPATLGRQFLLQLEQVEIEALSTSNPLTEHLPIQTKTFDLLGGDGKAIVLSQTEHVSAGAYHAIHLTLSQEAPIQFLDNSEALHNVQLGGSKENILTILVDFEVEAGKTAELVLDLDLEKSLKQEGNVYTFSPVGVAYDTADVQVIEQKVDKADPSETSQTRQLTYVCAYRSSEIQDGDASDTRGKSDEVPPGRQKRQGTITVEAPPSFDNSEDVVLDTTSACPNAYARAPVVDGQYRFEHLEKGHYQLRGFYDDGSFTDLNSIDIVTK